MPMPVKKATDEKVHFRLFKMPCCQFLACWVNPRLPNYCPECGDRVFAKIRVGDCTIMDSPAWLRVENTDSPNHL